MTRGIRAAGVALPRYRLASDDVADAWASFHAAGVDAVAVPSADEDAVTLGIAAARRALENGHSGATSIDAVADRIDTLSVATTTPPLAEEAYAPRIAAALGLPDDVRSWHHGQSTAAGADALQTALDAEGLALAVVADAPEGDPADEDHAFGAGAAAFLVGDDAPVTCEAIGAATAEAPGIRYREAGSERVTSLGVTEYERSTVRNQLRSAVEQVATDPGEVRAAALYQPNGALPYRVAGEGALENGTVAAGVVADRVGDLGAAGTAVGLVAALESDGDGAGEEGHEGAGDVVAGWFGGGSNAVAMRFAGGLDSDEAAAVDGGESVDYATYLRKRGFVGDGDVAGGGANVSLPTYQRTLPSRYARTAGQCRECGALSFPGEGACDACHERDALERVRLAREGTVATRTVIGQGGAPPEFAELQTREGAYGVAIVDLPARESGSTGDSDADATVRLPAQVTDCDPTEVEIGDTVRSVVRRIYTQDGVPRYGAKFVPVE